MATYQVNINMSAETVNLLQEGGFSLYGFKAVQASRKDGAPLVWFKMSADDLSLQTAVDWETRYEAFVSTSSIIPNGEITSGNHTGIDLGQTWEVDKTGSGPVVQQGPPTAISIHNQDSKRWTGGISQLRNGEASPLCAFPLFGNGLDVIAPIEKVLFMFATDQVKTSTVIFQAFTPGVLLDLTSDNRRDVSFDIDKQWNWGGASWGNAVPASTNLVPFLIESPTFSPEADGSFEHKALVFA